MQDERRGCGPGLFAVAAAASESSRLSKGCEARAGAQGRGGASTDAGSASEDWPACRACWSVFWLARSMDTRPSSFSSSWAVRELADLFDERFLVAAILWHSLPRRWHRSQPLPAGRRMQRHFALAQFVQDLP